VPITGRPAGWCDHIARMWPVTGVVGENGALYFNYDVTEKRLKKRFFSPRRGRRTRDRLMAAAAEVLAAVPELRFASDQPYRLLTWPSISRRTSSRCPGPTCRRSATSLRRMGSPISQLDPRQRVVRDYDKLTHDEDLLTGGARD